MTCLRYLRSKKPINISLTWTKAFENTDLEVNSGNWKVPEVHRVILMGIVELTHNKDFGTTLRIPQCHPVIFISL